jgi:glycosyltransferase involved in cell wall biosynthesis
MMGLLFFPRGGSAQVARYLVPALTDAGWSASLVGGSLGHPGEETHGPTFYGPLDLELLDYTAAVEAFERTGVSAVAAPVPMHPSYEDRPGAPDVVLSAVDPALAGHLAGVWERPFAAAGAARASVFHLHHLTPQHDAVRRAWPGVPLVAHLHGTEIKFVEAVEGRAAVAAAVGSTLEAMPEVVAAAGQPPAELDGRLLELWETTRWEAWRHGDWWTGHLRRQAASADHLVAVSPSDRASATTVLGIDPERVSEVPNGVDVERFRPRPADPSGRRERFRRWLVEEPQGWDETGRAGSVAYREPDLDRLLGPDGAGTVLVFVGRFTAAKRVPVLVRAFALARPRFEHPASLLIWGGHPGEWEDEHPVVVARAEGGDGIFFAGWRGHEDLPDALAACDALVMPSVNDSYPQTPLEAMATGLPVLATRSGGFPSMVNLDPARPTGWLVPPDDVDGLAGALVEAVNRPDERRQRGEAALAHARASFSWSGRVAGFEDAYERAAEARARITRRA